MLKKEIVNNTYLHSEITGKIIGCAMKVHRAMGNGFQEVIYQRCMQIEMRHQGLEFARELEKTLYYEGIEVGTRRVDFLVEDKIMLELKSVPALNEAHLSQALNYLQAYRIATGLLINFGGRGLEYKRVTNERRLERERDR